MIIFFCFIFAASISVTENFPDITLYTNEVYTGNLLNYFKGTNMTFEIASLNTPVHFTCSATFKLTPSSLIPLSESNPLIPLKLTATETSDSFLVLSMSNTTLILFSLSKINSTTSILFNSTITDLYENSIILQGILTSSLIILLLQTSETINSYSFPINQIIYSSIEEINFKVSQGFWDLRYLENLQMSTTDNEFLAFGVRSEGNQDAGIYVYSFANPENPELVQLINVYSTIPSFINDIEYPDPIDLEIKDRRLLILNSYGLIVMFDLVDEIFIEIGYGNFTEFGEVKHVSLLQAFWENLAFCTVTAGRFVVIYDTDLGSKLYFISSRVNIVKEPRVVYSQFMLPYVFFSTRTVDGRFYFEVAEIGEAGYQHLVVFEMDEGMGTTYEDMPWIVLPGVDRKYLVWQDFEGVRVFEVEIPSYLFRVYANESGSVVIRAKDRYGSAYNTMNLIVIEDLSQIYITMGYYSLPSNFYMLPVYFMNTTEAKSISIYNFVSGWDLSYDIGTNFTRIYNYTVSQDEKFLLWIEETVSEEYVYAVYYGESLYFINSEGKIIVNQNQTLDIPNAQEIVPLVDPHFDVAILYTEFIICFKYLDNLLKQVNLSAPCEFFLATGDTLLCASSESIQILNCSKIILEIPLKALNMSQNILDINHCQSFQQDVTYIYILTADKVYKILVIGSEYYQLGYEDLIAENIFCFGGIIAVLNNSYLSIYNELFRDRLRHFEMISTYEIAVLNEFILTIVDDGILYLYDIYGPTINSLISSFPIGTCNLNSVQLNHFLLNCSNQLLVYNSTCPPDCTKSSKLDFTLIDIDATVNGVYHALLPISVSNNIVNASSQISITLYTYGSTVFFDDSSISSFNLTYAYNVETAQDLKYYINGYNVYASLYINGQIADENDENSLQPVNLVNRSSFNFSVDFDLQILDYSIVDHSSVILFLTGQTIIVMNLNEDTDFVNTINLLEYVNGSCEAIEFIVRTKSSAVFVCFCTYDVNVSSQYYDGEVVFKHQSVSMLLFFTLDLVDYTIVGSMKYVVHYQISWLRVVNGPGNKFLVLCLSSRNETFSQVLNNEIYLYKGSWNPNSNTLTLSSTSEINFFNLKIETFIVTFIDGIYENSNDPTYTEKIFLYVSDNSFGLRVIQIVATKPFLIQSIPFVAKPVSLAVCGRVLYCITVETALKVFKIKDDYTISYYVTYPPSPVDQFVGINSAVTCSDYYYPDLISFYLKDLDETGMFKLRIINTEMNFNSSLHRDIDISCDKFTSFRVTSIFMNNQITYLKNNFKTFEIADLSDISLEFRGMSEEEYKQMVNKYGGKDDFNFTIVAFKERNEASVTSRVFRLNRYGPSKSGDSGEETDVLLLVVGIIAVIMLVLVCIAFGVYKRLMNKRRVVVPEVKKSRFEFMTLSSKFSRSVLRQYANPRASA